MPTTVIQKAPASGVEPPPFHGMFTLSHLRYILWLGAMHGTYWGLIFGWTTIFGMLRDETANPKHVLIWFIAFLAFLCNAQIIWAHVQGRPTLRTMYLHGYVFFGAAMACTLGAGVCVCVCDCAFPFVLFPVRALSRRCPCS